VTPLRFIVLHAAGAAMAWLASSTLSTRQDADDAPTREPARRATRAAYVHEPESSYETREMHGFTVMVSAAARANPRTTDPALDLLGEQLRQVTEVIPPDALAVLRRIRVWVEHMNPDRPCACYHVSRDWLVPNGYIEAKEKSVEISNALNFVNWVRDAQPWMILHELAHGYHDLVFTYDHAFIRRTYESARDAGLYDSVKHANGSDTRHYALTNPMEYFAELTESYFGVNDFFPFTREELRQHDPAGFAMIERCWRVREGRPVAFPLWLGTSSPPLDGAG